MGAPYVHHTIAFEFSNPDVILENEELYFQRGLECIREIYDYAKQQGVRTLCEEQGYLFNGIKGYSRFIDNVHVDVGTVADFGNIMQAGDVLEDFIPLFSNRIVHVHVKDYSVTPKHMRAMENNELYTKNKDYLSEHPFGEGQVNFAAIMEQLKKANYTGYFSVECGAVSKNTPERYLHNLKFTDEILTKYGF